MLCRKIQQNRPLAALPPLGAHKGRRRSGALPPTCFCDFSVLRSFAACAAKPNLPYAYSAFPAAELFFSLYHGKQEIPPVLAGFYRNFIFRRPGRAAAAAALYLAGRYDTIRDEASGPRPCGRRSAGCAAGSRPNQKRSASPYAIRLYHHAAAGRPGRHCGGKHPHPRRPGGPRIQPHPHVGGGHELCHRPQHHRRHHRPRPAPRLWLFYAPAGIL